MEQGPPVGQQPGPRREAPQQQALPMTQDIEADKHRHQPGDRGGDGGPADPPFGKGADTEDQQRIQHPVDQPGYGHHQAGGFCIAGRPDGGIAHHGQHQHGDGEIPDPHVVMDEGDKLGTGAQQGKQRCDGESAPRGEQGHHDHRQKQAVGGEMGRLIVFALPQGMTDHR